MVLSCRILWNCGGLVYLTGLRRYGIDAIAWRGDIFTVALRAAAGSGEPPAIAKYELTILAAGRFQNEPADLVMGDGLHDMFKMLLNLPLGNAEHLGQLVRRQTRANQQFDHALARGPWWIEHGRIVIYR